MADERERATVWPAGFKRVYADIDFGHGTRVGWVSDVSGGFLLKHEDGGETFLRRNLVTSIVNIGGQHREVAP